MIKDNMTAQEVFDHVVNHLRKQGRQARRNGGGCLYRIPVPVSLSCAVGCLMKDGEYRSEFEGLNILDLMGNALGIGPRLFEQCTTLYERLKPHRHLLYSLQSVHDIPTHDFSIERWEKGFADVAVYYGLTVPPKPEIQKES